MSEAPEHQAVIRQWINKAENDLRAAVQILKLQKDCPYDTVCFHSQQCAEKYLKALLILLGIDFPKTHDLTALLVKMPPTLNLQTLFPAASDLSPFAVDSRYPGGGWHQTRADAAQALRLARRIRKAVRAKLPRSVIQKDPTLRRRRS